MGKNNVIFSRKKRAGRSEAAIITLVDLESANYRFLRALSGDVRKHPAIRKRALELSVSTLFFSNFDRF